MGGRCHKSKMLVSLEFAGYKRNFSLLGIDSGRKWCGFPGKGDWGRVVSVHAYLVREVEAPIDLVLKLKLILYNDYKAQIE